MPTMGHSLDTAHGKADPWAVHVPGTSVWRTATASSAVLYGDALTPVLLSHVGGNEAWVQDAHLHKARKGLDRGFLSDGNTLSGSPIASALGEGS